MNRYDIALLIIDKLRISPTDSNGIMIAYRIADELLELIEQDKKATIKLILLGFQCALDEKQPERAVEETILRIAERYGVEIL